VAREEDVSTVPHELVEVKDPLLSSSIDLFLLGSGGGRFFVGSGGGAAG
jgi:hypothetical protein